MKTVKYLVAIVLGGTLLGAMLARSAEGEIALLPSSELSAYVGGNVFTPDSECTEDCVIPNCAAGNGNCGAAGVACGKIKVTSTDDIWKCVANTSFNCCLYGAQDKKLVYRVCKCNSSGTCVQSTEGGDCFGPDECAHVGGQTECNQF